MSMMEKGFWLATGGLAGLVLGMMLADDVDLDLASKEGNSVVDNKATGVKKIHWKAEQAMANFKSSEEDSLQDATISTDVRAETIKEAMDRIGASLDETLESLKPKATEATIV